MVRTTEADDRTDDTTTTADGDTVFVRTDDGVIEATVDDAEYSFDRPDDGARLGGTLDADDPSVHYVDYWHADHGIDTPEEAADAYADDPTSSNFDAIVAAVRAEYDEDDHDPHDANVLSPTGLAVRLAADALGYDAGSMIDFDRDDEVSIEYDSFDEDDPHATPIDLVKIAGFADDATDRTVRFRDGAGSVRVYVEVDR